WQFAHASVERAAINEWTRRDDKRSWYAHAVRDQLISNVREKAQQNVELIKTVIAVAPMLGLLGTVTGMVEVFDVMAISGSSNARAMSAGVSKATIPTMAGMVVALSGFYFGFDLERRAKQRVQELADHLPVDH
ncbi:MAG: MotA/TolQ/ExbB proton channel family protein, partial [Maricaulaceae bacterium]